MHLEVILDNQNQHMIYDLAETFYHKEQEGHEYKEHREHVKDVVLNKADCVENLVANLFRMQGGKFNEKGYYIILSCKLKNKKYRIDKGTPKERF